MWLALACSTERPPGDSGAGEAAWVDEPGTPTWSAEDVEAAFATALAKGIPEPLLARDTFISLLNEGDDHCPGAGIYSLNLSFVGCLSETGWLFAGHSEYTLLDDGFALLGDCYFVDPAGQYFIGAGELESEVTDDGWTATISGTWGYPDAVDWMAGTPEVVLDLSDSADRIRMAGGWTLDGVSVWFDEVVADPAVCDGVPTGVMRVRDDDGRWFILDPGEGCGPCGALSYDGAELGTEACVDLSSPLATLAGYLTP